MDQGNRLVQDESANVNSEIALKSDKFVSVSTQTEPLEKVSLATQTSSDFLNVEILCNPLTSTPISQAQNFLTSFSEMETNSTTTESNLSQSYCSSCSDIDESDDRGSNDDTLLANSPSTSNDKYIVFANNIEKLFTKCLADFSCSSSISSIIKSFKGSLVTYSITCCNHHTFIWHSQPILNNLPLGNLLLSAATLYTGNTYTNLSEIAQTCGIKLFNESTFYNIQKKWLFPTIKYMWQVHQQELYAGKFLIEVDRYIGQPIYISWYQGQVDISYWLSTTDKTSA